MLLSGKEVVRDDRTLMVKLDAHDAVFLSVAAGQTAAGAVVVSGDNVVGHCNFADVVTNDNDITVQFSSSGLFQF